MTPRKDEGYQGSQRFRAPWVTGTRMRGSLDGQARYAAQGWNMLGAINLCLLGRSFAADSPPAGNGWGFFRFEVACRHWALTLTTINVFALSIITGEQQS